MSGGIILQLPQFKIGLDFVSKPQGNILFVSHAHTDHMLKTKTPIPKLCSIETEKLVSMRRNKPLGNTIHEELSINDLVLRMVDTGHILGSRALIIENEKKIIFTSDFTLREREFLGTFIPEKCDVLIMEATFGKNEEYIFPPFEEIIKSAKDWVEEQLKKGFPVILIGYSLGKAQILSKIFEGCSPIYVQDNIKRVNDIYKECGVSLLDFESFQTKRLKSIPWVLIAPPGGRSSFVSTLKRKCNAKTAVFSGWGADEGSFIHRMKADKVFTLSDHADFKELEETVINCGPEKVFVTHGFDHEFAAHLRKLGFDAQPLSTKLISFPEV